MVRVKPIWSADNRRNVLAYIAGGPVYQLLKRLMNISTSKSPAAPASKNHPYTLPSSVVTSNSSRVPLAFDGVIDFDAATRDPNRPVHILAAFDSLDHLHPQDDGYKAIADSVDLKMLTAQP